MPISDCWKKCVNGIGSGNGSGIAADMTRIHTTSAAVTLAMAAVTVAVTDRLEVGWG